MHTVGIHYCTSITPPTLLSSGVGRTKITRRDIMMFTTLLGWLVLTFRRALKVKALLTELRGVGVQKSVLVINVTINICQQVNSLSMYIILTALDSNQNMKNYFSKSVSTGHLVRTSHRASGLRGGYRLKGSTLPAIAVLVKFRLGGNGKTDDLTGRPFPQSMTHPRIRDVTE